MNCSDLWQVDGTGTINTDVGVEIDLSPDMDAQLIVRADNVVRRYRDLLDRRKGRRDIAKEVGAENRQHFASGSSNELLKFSERLGRSRNRRRLLITVRIGCSCWGT